MTGRPAIAAAVGAAAIVGGFGYGLSRWVASDAPNRIGFAASTASPACLTTLTVGGKPNARGLVIWKYGTVRPTTTEHVCWTRGYKGKP